MKNKITVVYYTSNKEDEQFENKINKKLLKVIGDIPLISVSQKPMNFGKNICVGKLPFCDVSAHKQLLIGLEEAKTEFVLAAESDCLYPPEYFTFIPPTKDNVYRYNNVWLLYGWIGRQTRGLFWKKVLCEGAQICGREHWIKSLKSVLSTLSSGKPRTVFKTKLKYSWGCENPMISCKTCEGLRKYSRVIKEDSITPTDKLPYWGDASALRKEMFNR